MNIRYYTVEVMARVLKGYSSYRRNYPMIGTIGDHISLRVLLDGVYERNQLEFLHSVCIKNGLKRTYLDIGANIGNHTIYLADVFQRVIAIEASELTSRILQLNLDLNHIENVAVHNVAAGKESSTGYMSLSQEDNLGSNRLLSNPLKGKAVEVINVVSLDTYLSYLKDLDLVKIDIEGYEENALRGMEVLLKENSPIIAFESNSRQECRLIMDILNSYDYEYYYYLHKGFDNVPKLFKYFLRIFYPWNWKRLTKESYQVSDLIVASKSKISL
jgi:FkbM family methyltransferase